MVRSVGITPPPVPSGGFGTGTTDFARRLWWERRLRTQFFPPELFGEPAWDLLLDLFVAGRTMRRVPMNKSHLGACVVHSTAYRRVRRLIALGLVSTTPVEGRKRVREIALTSLAIERLERLLEETWFSRMEDRATGHQDELSSNRGNRLDKLAAQLSEYREELDSLAAWEAGAHLNQAISALERHRSRVS